MLEARIKLCNLTKFKAHLCCSATAGMPEAVAMARLIGLFRQSLQVPLPSCLCGDGWYCISWEEAPLQL